MKFAVVGAGAIGGYLGARLAAAGEQVTFIARNRNLEAINANGFRLVLEDGSTLHARDVRAVRDMADAGPQDAVLLTVKAHQVVDLLPALRGLFGPQTMVVSMLNGVPWWYFHKLAGDHEGRRLESVDPGGRIAAAIEPERVIGSIVYPAAELVEPGLVRVIEGNRFTLGEPDGTRSERIEALSQALMKAGFKAPANLSYDQALANLDKNGFKGANVKFASVEGERVVFVTVPSTPELKVGDEGSKAKIATAVGVEPAGMLSFTEIGPSVADETIRNAVMGIVISSLLIVLWLTIRFGVALGGLRSGIKFGLSAIGALVHDILVVVGVAAIVGKLLGWEVSALFITAMLTVIGFSVHDTIVIFDRIRENLRRQQRGEDFAHLCNRSITQSFARSINTSMTVIATLIVLIIAGTATPDLKFFCVTMLVGIVSGTYSSIFNAAPILYLWDRATGKVKGEEHTLIAEAQREQARMRAIAMEVERERQATQGEPAATRSTYSQVRRRSSAVSKGTQTLDDDEK